jgi:glutathione reductase (NADPH)
MICIKVRVKCEDASGWQSSRRVNEKTAMYKTVADERTGRMLGAHLLGPGAEEVINIFALAIRKNVTVSDLSHMIFAYPTNAANIPYMF